MTMQFSSFPLRRDVTVDGVSNTVTVDFSEDIKRETTFANSQPTGFRNVSASLPDASGNLIPFTVSRHGRKIIVTFDSVPPVLNINGDPNVFNLIVTLLFDAD